MRATDNFFERKREWSRLKDEILATYLRPYLTKITTTGRPVLVVDCFAGKGRFDDGELGSPLLICQAIENASRIRPNAEIGGLFIERKYHGELEENLHPFSQCEVLSGAYEQHIADIGDRITAGTNVLLFVDPYGIKSLDMSRFRHLLELQVGSVELIMNLTTFGFLREGCRLLSIDGFESQRDSDVYEDDPDSPNSVERMNAIAGGSYWRRILEDYYGGSLDMRSAEQAFTLEYTTHLRELLPHVVDIPVQYRRGNLPKYRLIYGTQNADGLILMADKMSRVWRDFATKDRGGQEALFEEIDYPDMASMEGYSLEDDILSLADPGVELKALIVHLVTKYGITFPEGELKQRIKDMGEQGVLAIHRDPPTTPKAGRPATSMDYNKYRIQIERIGDG